MQGADIFPDHWFAQSSATKQQAGQRVRGVLNESPCGQQLDTSLRLFVEKIESNTVLSLSLLLVHGSRRFQFGLLSSVARLTAPEKGWFSVGLRANFEFHWCQLRKLNRKAKKKVKTYSWTLFLSSRGNELEWAGFWLTSVGRGSQTSVAESSPAVGAHRAVEVKRRFPKRGDIRLSANRRDLKVRICISTFARRFKV